MIDQHRGGSEASYIPRSPCLESPPFGEAQSAKAALGGHLCPADYRNAPCRVHLGAALDADNGIGLVGDVCRSGRPALDAVATGPHLASHPAVADACTLAKGSDCRS